MQPKGAFDRFSAELREVSLSLAKKRFWTLLREQAAAQGVDSAARLAMLRAAADEVARLTEPSARIDLNGHSASSLLRALAEAAKVDPPAFEGVRGRGPDDSLVHISPFEPTEALFSFACRKKDEETVFVHGYFNFSARGLQEWLALKHGRDAASFQRMSAFIAQAQTAAPEAALPHLADAILARLR